MSIQEHRDEDGNEPAISENLIHADSSSVIRSGQERTWRTRLSRLRKMIIRSGNREPYGIDLANDYYNWKDGEEGRRGRQARIFRKGSRFTNRCSRTFSNIKGRFGNFPNHRPSLNEESCAGVDEDASRNEDAQVLAWQNVGQSEFDLFGSNDSISSCLFLKGPSKYDESWIPRMIYKVISCSWYWGDIDRFQAAVALQAMADGYFLLRKSAQPDYLFTISFRRFNKTMHVRIENLYAGKDTVESIQLPGFLMGEISPSYNKLLELIEHFGKPVEENFGSLPLLLCPLYRRTPFSLKELARAAVYQWCNSYTNAFFKIDSLYIPEELRLYLREFAYTQNIFHTYE